MEPEEKANWQTAAIVIVSALLLTTILLGGLAYWGGQDWLLPSRQRPAANVQGEGDPNFGLAEPVDRTVEVDAQGKVAIDGIAYDDAALRDYLKKLVEAGGVYVSLKVNSLAPTDRRLTVEKICAEVTGLDPTVSFVEKSSSPTPIASDLETIP